MPKDIGEAKAGQPCPNNPFERESELFAEIQNQMPLLEIAKYYSELAAIGAVHPAECSPEEWTVVRIMMQREKLQQAQAFQSGILRIVHLKPGQE